MTDAELWGAWRVWMAVAAVIVVIAAALLVTILVVARRILAEATRALHAAEAIRANTQAVWALQTTNDVAEQILGSVGGLAKKGAALLDALQGTTVGGRHAQ